MTPNVCDRVSDADLTDYAAGELTAAEAAVIEDHFFSCADCGRRAAGFEALVCAAGDAVRSAAVGGFVTDEILNRLAREGVRVRSFVLAPGAAVPCAVWDDDELMVLRLRGDFGEADEITLSQRIAGAEVMQATARLAPGPHQELIHAVPADTIRGMPVVEVEVVLTARTAGEAREVGRYTLLHGGEAHHARQSL